MLAGTGAVLASLPKRRKAAELAVTYFFCLTVGAPLAGMDVSVPWVAFSEASLALCILALIVALARYGYRELREGEYD